MRLRFLFLFIIFSCSLYSQGEANNWFFGKNSGMNFINGTRPTFQGGSLNTIEGCASISDKDGNLLFYSDGITVYNRSHEIMENGANLKGHSSSTQSAIIVPNPVDENIYYLFTVGQIREAGFHYYTVDMSKNGGEGAIIGDSVDLDPSGGDYSLRWSEKITAVKSNSCDYWVITLVADKIFAYKIDENGVDKNPVISDTEFVAAYSRGYLKVSPNGKKLAAAHQGIIPDKQKLILYDFNRNTGEATNETILYESQKNEQPYGVEFSAQSTKLYTTTTDFMGAIDLDDDDAPKSGDWRLYQFDLKEKDIASSMTLIHTEMAFRGALQLGPDKKIYATLPVSYFDGTRFLSAILEPERKGKDCKFDLAYVDLGSKKAMQGLPPFIQSIFAEEEINIVNPFEEVSVTSKELALCEDSSYVLEGPIAPEGETWDYFWTFDDGNVEVDLPLPSPQHKLTINSNSSNNTGTYKLTIDTHDKCNLLFLGEAYLTFTDPPEVKPLTSLVKCDQFDENPDDGLTLFDLNDGIDDLTYNKPDEFKAFYYLNNADAIADSYNQNSLPAIFANSVPNQNVVVKLFHLSSLCYALSEITLVVNDNLTLLTDDMVECEIEDDQAVFDLNSKKNDILANLNVAGSLEISFYNSIEDALDNINGVSGSRLTEGDEIFFNVEMDGICYGSGRFDLIVSTFPPLEPDEFYTLCSFEYPIVISATIPEDIRHNYEYSWSTGENSHEISIDSEQTVNLIIRAKLNDCEYLKTFIIDNAPIPTIVNYEVSTENELNAISVFTDNDHENEYAIGSQFSEFQESNVFPNLIPGVYDIFIRNKFECTITTKKVYVLGFPKFFTPNNDGHNDNWEIQGLDNQNFTFSNIHIFDRYGKVLGSIKPNDSWNGIYNGKQLPSTDYWFSVDITDRENITKNYRGHFSLIFR